MKIIYLAPLNVVHMLGSGLFLYLCLAAGALIRFGRPGPSLICLLLGGLLLLIGKKLGLLNGKEGLRSKIRDAWTEVQRLAAQCNSIEGMTKRSKEIWGPVAPEGRPREYQCDVRGNRQAFQKMSRCLTSKAALGFWLCRVYLNEYEHTTELLSTKTLFAVVIHTCKECSSSCNAVCRLAEHFGDRFGISGAGQENE